MHVEHRLVKYKRNIAHQKIRSSNETGEFNCEMVVTDDIQKELFQRWKSQDKCRIFSYDGNLSPYQPKLNEWLSGNEMSHDRFNEELPWNEYNCNGIYY